MRQKIVHWLGGSAVLLALLVALILVAENRPTGGSGGEVGLWRGAAERLNITVSEAKERFDRKDALFVDARSASDYAEGHIPGALSLPVDELGAQSRTLLKNISGDTRLIVYCEGEDCQSSVTLAGILVRDFGYPHSQVLYDGWRAWLEAGFPVEKGN